MNARRAAALGAILCACASDRVLPGESHLRRVRQLTFGGQNAEAYWSFDDERLVLQATREGMGCDQVFVLDVASGHERQVTFAGRATCAFFLPGDERVLFASTMGHSPDCPPEPDRSQGYVWPLYEYDVYVADLAGGAPVNITNSPGYDAEATVAPDGRILFTSVRSGDLELWTMNDEGGEAVQLTHELGYDGGGFFSPDGRMICWRASRPQGAEEAAAYQALLAQGLVRPSKLDIYVAQADGSDVRRLTDNGKANFAPYFLPDGQGVIFCSNLEDPKGRLFDLFTVRLDGTGLERVTRETEFDGFPMFSWDGERLAFASNRFGSVPGETNIFVADWVP